MAKHSYRISEYLISGELRYETVYRGPPDVAISPALGRMYRGEIARIVIHDERRFADRELSQPPGMKVI